jgi:hypothetical protein
VRLSGEALDRGKNGMAMRPFSEMLFEHLCSTHGVSCEAIPTGLVRTPDFAISLAGVRIVCEIKQIDPNDEDLQELEDRQLGQIDRSVRAKPPAG